MPTRKKALSALEKTPERPPLPKSHELLEVESLDGRRLAAETESIELRTTLQRWVTRFIPRAVVAWLILLFLFILADSINLTWTSPVETPSWIESFEFDIDTYVMVALVGSTTLAVGGLVNFALKGLLGKSQDLP